MTFFNDLITSLFDRKWFFKSLHGSEAFGLDDLDDLLNAVITAEGEVSALVHAQQMLTLIDQLDDHGRQVLFEKLLALDLNAPDLAQAALDYAENPSVAALARITETAEPHWLELFRRLNAAPNGTVKLVRLRQHLLQAAKQNPEFLRLDVGFKALMRGWFNPGFLVLKPIDWSSPADILEKIIAYEAVHEIKSWDDLRARLAPEDRRCFAFFHPTMPDEPLIFVEVALMQTTPEAIQEVLTPGRAIISQHDANSAIFYSISNCQQGLAGISFGNFLIKRVAQELQRDLPKLKRFVTLSPVPGFMAWLKTHDPDLHEKASAPDVMDQAASLTKDLQKAAASYFLNSSRPDQAPNDPVARFHLGNGALLERINLFADASPKAIKQSAGMMVNYLYELGEVEKRHEDYARHQTIHAADTIKQYLKA